MSTEQKKDIGAELTKLAENSKVSELSKKVTEHHLSWQKTFLK